MCRLGVECVSDHSQQENGVRMLWSMIVRNVCRKQNEFQGKKIILKELTIAYHKIISNTNENKLNLCRVHSN